MCARMRARVCISTCLAAQLPEVRGGVCTTCYVGRTRVSPPWGTLLGDSHQGVGHVPAQSCGPGSWSPSLSLGGLQTGLVPGGCCEPLTRGSLLKGGLRAWRVDTVLGMGVSEAVCECPMIRSRDRPRCEAGLGERLPVTLPPAAPPCGGRALPSPCVSLGLKPRLGAVA